MSRQRVGVGQSWQERERLIIGLGLLLLASVSRLHDLGGPSLWGDEVNMVRFASGERDLQETSGNAIGYLPLLAAILEWQGRSDFWLRLPAALGGALLPPLFFLFVQRWSGTLLAAGGGVLLAVSPMHLLLSRQVHAWSAVALVSVLSLAACVHLIRRPGLAAAVLWALAHTFLLRLTLMAGFLMMAEFAAVLVWWFLLRRQEGATVRAVPWLAWLAAGTALWMAGNALFLNEWVLKQVWSLVSSSGSSSPALGGGPVFRLGPEAIGGLLTEFVTAGKRSRSLLETVAVVASWLLVLAGTFKLARLWGWPVAAAAQVFVWLPILPLVLFSYVNHIDLGARRLIFIVGPYTLLLAAGLLQVAELLARRRSTHIRLAASLLALTIGAACLSHYTPGVRRLDAFVDLETAALVTSRFVRPQDQVVAWKRHHLDHYYRDLRPQGTAEPFELLGLGERIETLSPQNGRLWLVAPIAARKNRRASTSMAWVRERCPPSLTLQGGLRLFVLDGRACPESEFRLQMVRAALENRPGNQRLCRQLRQLGGADESCAERGSG